MREYRGWTLDDITEELAVLEPPLAAAVKSFFDEKEALGDGTYRPPSDVFRIGEDGNKIHRAFVSTADLNGNRYFRATGSPDGSSTLYAIAKDEDPVLQEMIDRTSWLKWRQRVLVSEEMLRR